MTGKPAFRKSAGSGPPIAGQQHLRESRQRATQVLPHTWQANTYHTHQGNTYYVDVSGQYWMADPNGSGNWQPLHPAR